VYLTRLVPGSKMGVLSVVCTMQRLLVSSAKLLAPQIEIGYFGSFVAFFPKDWFSIFSI
jgi:hypothetical protein